MHAALWKLETVVCHSAERITVCGALAENTVSPWSEEREGENRQMHFPWMTAKVQKIFCFSLAITDFTRNIYKLRSVVSSQQLSWEDT